MPSSPIISPMSRFSSWRVPILGSSVSYFAFKLLHYVIEVQGKAVNPLDYIFD